jgi:hypothetical protein
MGLIVQYLEVASLQLHQSVEERAVHRQQQRGQTEVLVVLAAAEVQVRLRQILV